MKYVDVLVDEYECDKRDTQLHWKGSSNQRVTMCRILSAEDR